MLTPVKITRIWIEQIEQIEAEELTAYEAFEYAQRSLTIRTTDGEAVTVAAATPREGAKTVGSTGWTLRPPHGAGFNQQPRGLPSPPGLHPVSRRSWTEG